MAARTQPASHGREKRWVWSSSKSLARAAQMSAEGHEPKIRAVRTCFEYNLAQTAGRRPVIHWKKIDEFIEPNWEKMAALASPVLFWRGKKQVAVFGYIRDGELFDHKWMYVCDSSKVTHFSEVNGPGSNVVQLHPDGSV